jgi:hypothetical protein
MDLTGGAKTETFIFGIAVDGLTPFEAKLHGKKPGDELDFSVAPEEGPAFMGHLCEMLPRPGPSGGPLFVRVKVVNIGQAKNREVVAAMAELSACGEGCCGNH